MTRTLLASIAFAATSAYAKVVELSKEVEKVYDKFYEKDFTVVSFYTSDEYSKLVDGLMDGAKAIIDAEIEDGTITDRDIAWLRIDLEANPELGLDQSGYPAQVIMNNVGQLQRYIGFNYFHESKEEAELDFASVIKNFTGDFITEIDCEDIQSDDRPLYDEVIFFGKEESLDSDVGLDLEVLAMVDRYNYHQSPVGFHYVTDPKCRQEVGLDASKEFISMFNGYNALPTHLLADDKLDFRTLNYRLQTGVNLGTPRWSQRSYAGIFEMMTNALVFLTPEGSLLDHSTLSDDWRAALMAKTTEFIQDADLPLIPIFA